MKIVVDHVAGSRRGQRQEFLDLERCRFGRHPSCDVTFDAHRDLDASSRHAELRRDGDDYILFDVGSSNGTLVGGARVNEVRVEAGVPVEVEFGSGGPRVRLFVGAEDAEPPPPPDLRSRGWLRRAWWLLLGALAAGGILAALSWT